MSGHIHEYAWRRQDFASHASYMSVCKICGKREEHPLQPLPREPKSEPIREFKTPEGFVALDRRDIRWIECRRACIIVDTVHGNWTLELTADFPKVLAWWKGRDA